MINRTGKDALNILLRISMKEIGKIINNKDMVNIFILMELNIKDTGKIINK